MIHFPPPFVAPRAFGCLQRTYARWWLVNLIFFFKAQHEQNLVRVDGVTLTTSTRLQNLYIKIVEAEAALVEERLRQEEGYKTFQKNLETVLKTGKNDAYRKEITIMNKLLVKLGLLLTGYKSFGVEKVGNFALNNEALQNEAFKTATGAIEGASDYILAAKQDLLSRLTGVDGTLEGETTEFILKLVQLYETIENRTRAMSEQSRIVRGASEAYQQKVRKLKVTLLVRLFL
jgi:hypothetical protein